jgi:hypothetical protein
VFKRVPGGPNRPKVVAWKAAHRQVRRGCRETEGRGLLDSRFHCLLFGIKDLQSGAMLLFGPETPAGQLLCNQKNTTVCDGFVRPRPGDSVYLAVFYGESSGCAKRTFCSLRQGRRRHYVDPKQAVLYVESLFLEKHHGSED